MQSFAAAIRSKDFVITAGLSLPQDASATEIRNRVHVLRDFVDSVQIDDDYAARGSVDSIAVAAIALSEGVDPIVHMSCRDRNKIALRAALVGATVIGVSSVLLARGEKIPEQMRGKVKGVFDTTATQLIQLARQIGGAPGGDEGPLHVGTFAPVIRPPEGWMAERITDKITAGAKFIQTRPCLNATVLQRYMQRIVELGIPRRLSIIVDVPLMTSADAIRRIGEEYPSVRIPGSVARRIASAARPEHEGALACGEFIATLRDVPGVAGANIVGSPDPGLTVAAIERSRAAP